MQNNDDAPGAGHDEATTPGRNRATTQARQHPRQGRDNPTTQAAIGAATSRDVSHPDVLTVAQAAQLLGLSARTIQRQCRAGKLRSTRLETEFGKQWEIERAEVERAATEARRTPRPGRDTPTTTPRQTHDRAATQGTTNQRQGRDDEPEQRHDARRDGHDDEGPQRRDVAPENARPDAKSDQGAAPDFAARYVAQIEAENAFLRAAVEQHQRSEAELRATLREALKAQPRQLEQGNVAAETATERAQIVTPTNTASPTPEAVKPPQNATGAAPMKEPRPLWKVVLGIR